MARRRADESNDLLVGLVACAFIGAYAWAGDDRPVRQVFQSRQGVTVVVPAAAGGTMDEFAPLPDDATPVTGAGTWVRQNCPSGLFLRQIAMPSPQVGYVCGELGVVAKTTDGGATWTTILSTGFPYYYYGIQAFDPNTVIVAGFQNQTGDGVIRWSDNGGASWTPHITLAAQQYASWLYYVRFIDRQHGLIQTQGGGIQVTRTGGRSAGDWTYVRPTDNWWQGPFTFLPDGRAWMTGYDNFRSADFGQTWTRIADADPLFDGANSILASGQGFIGGGSISPTVEGWVYGTTDGGDTWGPRLVTTPYPVRALLTLNPRRAWAAGGNYFSNVGGIWTSANGGQTWELEQNTGAELVDINFVRLDDSHIDVYAVGMISQIWRQPYELPRVAGDANCDGEVDFGDINPFVTALAGRETYYRAHPGCNWLNADANNDGAVDFGDINPFVELLSR